MHKHKHFVELLRRQTNICRAILMICCLTFKYPSYRSKYNYFNIAFLNIFTIIRENQFNSAQILLELLCYENISLNNREKIQITHFILT